MPTIPHEIISAAQESEKKWSIPASVSIAQWAIESGYGRHMPPGSFNPFGIKARAGEPRVGARTREVLGGKTVYINDGFRKFASIAEAFDKHGEFLATRTPYAHARTKLPDPDAFADALTGVYATDPHYGTVLKGLMRSANLYQYNEGGVPRKASRPTLKLGSRGPEVAQLQRYLHLPDDGIFGKATEAAVIAFQLRAKIVADGVAGPHTLALLDSD